MARRRPNFLLIVADDLGFSDCSCYGSEIKTPNIDSLAQDGLRFTDFHTASACSPTRAMLMTGTDHHLTGLGQMVEHMMNVKAYNNKPGHEGYLIPECATLPEVLRDSAGYFTTMSGKWHLGVELDHCPHYRGFDRSFALLAPAANHFAWEPEIEETGQIPKFAQVNVTALHVEDDHYFDNDDLPKDFYSSDFYTTKLIEQLDQRPADKPFFAYLPFTAPHWPFQAPQSSILPYRGLYSSGPGALRQKRLSALQSLNLIPKDIEPHPIICPEIPVWNALTPDERAKSARAMEAYAGMVARMDYNIGRILDYLRAHDLYDSTQIIFMSDNGAEGYSYERPLTSNPVQTYLENYYDNSLDNIGNKNSYVWYGGRWAQAATAPSRMYKKYTTEGGVRVPLIFKPPQWGQNSALPASICHDFCTVQDIMPTFLDQAGVATPQGTYNGRAIKPIRGASWLPFLEGKAATPHPEDYVAGWQLFGHAALRKGHWKINLVKKPRGWLDVGNWELHNLASDPGETNDLSKSHPEKLQELLQHWREYVREVGVVLLPPEKTPGQHVMDDEMADVTTWMKVDKKYDTSWGVAARERAKRDANKGTRSM